MKNTGRLGLVSVVVLAMFTAIAGCHKNDGTQVVDAAAANGNLAPVSNNSEAAPVNESAAPAQPAPNYPAPAPQQYSQQAQQPQVPAPEQEQPYPAQDQQQYLSSRRIRISSIKARTMEIRRTRTIARWPSTLPNRRPLCRNTSSRRARNQTTCGPPAIGPTLRPATTGFREFGLPLRTSAPCGLQATGAMM